MTQSNQGVNRRHLLKSGAALAGTAALFSAVNAAFPAGAFSATSGPEITGTKLGYIALTDAAPLIIAKEKGLFAKYGLPDMEIVKQASWGATRDNMQLGTAGNGIDGAHILTPMCYAFTAGTVTQNNQPLPMALVLRLNLNSQGISVASGYSDLKVGLDSSPLKPIFARKKAEGKPAKVAMTFPGGTHDLWLRYWLAAGGIDPDQDVDTIVVPPPQMVANMKVGTMDAFCVGEPWNAQLIHQKAGYTALTTGELWADHPEKALGLRADFVEKNPKATQAIIMAVIEAQQWCDDPAHKDEMAAIIGTRSWFNVPPADIIERIKGHFDYGTGRVVENSPYLMKFWRDHASYPFKSHDLWFLTEDRRWGKLPGNLDSKALIAKVNRSDLWREAAQALGVAAADIPAGDSRGVERFFDGKVFDPENPAAYLASLTIKRLA